MGKNTLRESINVAENNILKNHKKNIQYFIIIKENNI
jgi:hypothetical protein